MPTSSLLAHSSASAPRFTRTRVILSSGLTLFGSGLLVTPDSRLVAGPSMGGEFTWVGGIVSGSGSSAGGTFNLEGTAGLPTAAVSTGGAFVLSGGLIGVYIVPGDLELSLDRTQDGQVLLTWPAGAEGYVLEFASQVSPGADWSPVTPSPTANFLSLPFDQPARFYRLRKK